MIAFHFFSGALIKTLIKTLLRMNCVLFMRLRWGQFEPITLPAQPRAALTSTVLVFWTCLCCSCACLCACLCGARVLSSYVCRSVCTFDVSARRVYV